MIILVVDKCPLRSTYLLNPTELRDNLLTIKKLMSSFEGTSNNYKSTPVFKAWKDYVPALKYYYNLHSLRILSVYGEGKPLYFDLGNIILPPWMEDENIINSHRSWCLATGDDYEEHEWDVVTENNIVWPEEGEE